ncbi:hypothetical protein ABPG74_005360 [Tetrahymena malaccensis]
MAQACDKYTSTALMGNWYEERLAPNQPFRENLQTKTVREEEAAISFASDTNKLIPLSRVNRNLPWDTKGVIADDGFKEFRSVNRTSYDPINLNNYYNLGDCRQIYKHYTAEKKYPENNPTQIQTLKANQYSLLNQTNSQHIHKERQVPNNVSDFGSTFKKFPETHEKFFGMTTYQQSFSRPLKETAQQIIAQSEKKINHFAGTNERPVHQQSTKMTSVLTAEKYKNEQEPKDNTSIQRSWLPYKDKALQVAQNNLIKNETLNQTKGFTPFNPLITYKNNLSQVQQHDIATSLPIGSGEHSDQKRTNQPGEFRHVRTDVTLIRNKPVTKR